MCPSLPKAHTNHVSAPNHADSLPKTWGQGRGGSRWQAKRVRVFERDKYLCQICLAKGILTPVLLHGKGAGICDHKVPKSEGGTDDIDNLQTTCKPCSDIKTQEESSRARAKEWEKMS